MGNGKENLEGISEKEFLKILFESEREIISRINADMAIISNYDQIRAETKYYKSLGYKVDYFINQEGNLTYDVLDRKIGFSQNNQ